MPLDKPQRIVSRREIGVGDASYTYRMKYTCISPGQYSLYGRCGGASLSSVAQAALLRAAP